ncbi:hypothetical protein C7974DRAFT_139576 [Boeremia exigua]|uniref:uncharacterized protein n=1 Tax=Boeremia exigua TaxID=749465 RepID=UPI001E8CA32A|nr:uncharacterized protein C7974DRAFT_139576 [Boeremia exigua]KAH6639842.1 hypothetical protein C7974DRAFT_139576 [Boeremia exigua]
MLSFAFLSAIRACRCNIVPRHIRVTLRQFRRFEVRVPSHDYTNNGVSCRWQIGRFWTLYRDAVALQVLRRTQWLLVCLQVLR